MKRGLEEKPEVSTLRPPANEDQQSSPKKRSLRDAKELGEEAVCGPLEGSASRERKWANCI